MARFLLDHGTDPSIRNKAGKTAREIILKGSPLSSALARDGKLEKVLDQLPELPEDEERPEK